MKGLVTQLNAMGVAELRAWIIAQLRGENPGDLRQPYEAAHFPVAAVYPFLSPSTRESLQRIVFELMRGAAVGDNTAPPHEIFALVDPVFSSSALTAQVKSLLLSLAPISALRSELRYPTLLALIRSGHKGSAAFWKEQLIGPDDDALVVILQGLAQASASEFFVTLRDLEWSPYIASCVASLTPWLVEQFGAEAILPRLLHVLSNLEADLRKPVLAMIRPHDVPMPRSTRDWVVSIERYASGESEETPWDIFAVAQASSRWKSIAEERLVLERSLDDWISGWSPRPDDMNEARRVARLLRRHPTVSGVTSLIGALESLSPSDLTAEREAFFRDALDVISASPSQVRLLWKADGSARVGYARWLAEALRIPALQDVVMNELMKWVDAPDAAPLLELIIAGQMAIDELVDIARKTMNEKSVVKLVYEIYQSAVFIENEAIVDQITRFDPTFAKKFIVLEQERGLGPFRAMYRQAAQKERADV